jgi:hypothetical protein
MTYHGIRRSKLAMNVTLSGLFGVFGSVAHGSSLTR